MSGLRSFVILAIFACALSACVKNPTLAFYNGTADELTVRAVVDTWFKVTNCSTGDSMSSMNQQGSFTVPAGQFVCMTAKSRKDKLPAAELVSRVVVIRQGERCFTASRDELRDSLTRAGGFSAVQLTDTRCPAAGSAPPAAPDAE